MRRRTGVFMVAAALLASALLGSAEVPVTVSPGAASQQALTRDRCPTFSWGAVGGAKSYELVVYRLGRDFEQQQPVIRQSLPGSASTWTPSLGSCLERGGDYAWTVRALGLDGTSEWSRPGLFGVAAGPSEAELEAALQVVRTYLEGSEGSGGMEPAPAAAGESPTATTPGTLPLFHLSAFSRAPTLSGDSAFRAEVSSSQSTTNFAVQGLQDNESGLAAIYGEVTNPLNGGIGVLGITGSLNGRGVAGINAAPDDEHPPDLHGIALQGQSDHGTDGVGVLGLGDGIGVKGTGLSVNGYGGFFDNPSGDLIAADAAADLVTPDFRVDNSGKVFAPAAEIVGQLTAGSLDMGAFVVRKLSSALAAGTQINSPSCAADEVRTGGGCECASNGSATSIGVQLSRPEGNDFWRCECQPNNLAKAWVVCLGSPPPP